MQRKLISNLQILRFVAAFSVLVAHAADVFVPQRGIPDRLPLTAGVDIFFIISGFVMTWLTRTEPRGAASARIFLIRRAIRIVPPYWFFTTLLVIVVLVSPEMVRNTVVSPGSLITSYAFIPWVRPDGQVNPILSQGWTLNYEAFFYLAFAASLLVNRGLLFLLATFCGLAAASLVVGSSNHLASFYTDPIILEFAAGCLLARLCLRGTRLPAWGSAACLAGAVAAYLLLEPFVFGAFGRAVGWGIPALLLVAALVLSPEPEQLGIVRRALHAGGDASYTIYLSHTFTINALAVALARSGSVPPELACAIAIVGAIAAAMLFYRLVERPVTARLQRQLSPGRIRPAHDVAP